MSSLCIIPARSGSQRIKGKNIKLFHGKPIIAYSIEVAKESGLFDKIVVSTDSREIADVACIEAEIHHRQKMHAKDDFGTQMVAMMVIRDYKKSFAKSYDRVCVIYPCSPLLTVEDLRKGYNKLTKGVDYTLSVGTKPLQDAGNFYWGHAEAFNNGRPLFAEKTRMIPLPSNRVCDINTPEDFARAEKMYGELHGIS